MAPEATSAKAQGAPRSPGAAPPAGTSRSASAALARISGFEEESAATHSSSVARGASPGASPGGSPGGDEERAASGARIGRDSVDRPERRS